MKVSIIVLLFLFFYNLPAQENNADTLVINDQEYLEMRGVNVMLAHDFYPESHQGGVGIIQNRFGMAVSMATNRVCSWRRNHRLYFPGTRRKSTS